MKKGTNGVCIYWKKELFEQEDIQVGGGVAGRPNDERVLLWKHSKSRMMIIGIYAPVQWKEKLDFYQGLSETVKREQEKGYRVVAGDLNLTLDYGNKA